MIQVYHIPLHDQREIMERPFFSLAKKEARDPDRG